jgi:transcription elongation factor SPT6
LELLAENTRGVYKKKGRLSRLHRRSHSPASKRRTVVESSDDDLFTGEQPRRIDDISKIWDDDRRGDDEDEDIDDFIEYSDEEASHLNEAAAQEEKRQKMRRKRAQVRPELVGIDAKYVSQSIILTNLVI